MGATPLKPQEQASECKQEPCSGDAATQVMSMAHDSSTPVPHKPPGLRNDDAPTHVPAPLRKVGTFEDSDDDTEVDITKEATKAAAASPLPCKLLSKGGLDNAPPPGSPYRPTPLIRSSLSTEKASKKILPAKDVRAGAGNALPTKTNMPSSKSSLRATRGDHKVDYILNKGNGPASRGKAVAEDERVNGGAKVVSNQKAGSKGVPLKIIAPAEGRNNAGVAITNPVVKRDMGDRTPRVSKGSRVGRSKTPVPTSGASGGKMASSGKKRAPRKDADRTPSSTKKVKGGSKTPVPAPVLTPKHSAKGVRHTAATSTLSSIHAEKTKVPLPVEAAVAKAEEDIDWDDFEKDARTSIKAEEALANQEIVSNTKIKRARTKSKESPSVRSSKKRQRVESPALKKLQNAFEKAQKLVSDGRMETAVQKLTVAWEYFQKKSRFQPASLPLL
jgi:hypothetical protein